MSQSATIDSASPTRAQHYAVIDLAVAEDMQALVTRLPPDAGETLLARSMPAKVRAVGPWLVQLAQAPQVAAALAKMDAGVPWGYYLHSPVAMTSLRQSLRRFNLAQLPDAERPVLFRYWDPRVMQVWLDVATDHQRRQLFQWIDRIEAADGAFDASKSPPAGEI